MKQRIGDIKNNKVALIKILVSEIVKREKTEGVKTHEGKSYKLIGKAELVTYEGKAYHIVIPKAYVRTKIGLEEQEFIQLLLESKDMISCKKGIGNDDTGHFTTYWRLNFEAIAKYLVIND
jgi:hypothetical protein